jgi:uncharacterized protein YndB with AHSA1/START domain
LKKDYLAKSTVAIDAPVDDVWKALTDPDLVRKYMHGTNLETDWKVGGTIFWSGEWKGKPYKDKGKVLEFAAPNLLKYTHWSPMGGSEDKPENYHTVTYELDHQGTRTVLSLTQDNNASQEAADEMAEKNWRPVLQGLREVAEKQRTNA